MHPNLTTEPGYPEKYRDSVALDARGNVPASASTPPRGRFIPTVNNSYGWAMRQVYEFIVDETGANLYIDEITVGIPSRGPYGEWDGCTVEINPGTHAVERKLSQSALLMLPWFEEMMGFLESRGGTAFANTAPNSRTMANWNLQHFTEDTGQSGVVSTHLSTPLAWAYRRGEAGFRHLMESLDYGGIAFTRGGDWSDHMFPITPVELGPGYVIAEERILTNRSGKFGWGDDSRAEVYMYDGRGGPVDEPLAEEIMHGETVFTEIRMPSDHFAVLVRKN